MGRFLTCLQGKIHFLVLHATNSKVLRVNHLAHRGSSKNSNSNNGHRMPLPKIPGTASSDLPNSNNEPPSILMLMTTTTSKIKMHNSNNSNNNDNNRLKDPLNLNDNPNSHRDNPHGYHKTGRRNNNLETDGWMTSVHNARL